MWKKGEQVAGSVEGKEEQVAGSESGTGGFTERSRLC